MARKLRIEYPGALYPIINRGNYRRDLFESTGSAEAFLKVLGEAAPRFGWKLHAYVLMRNHYHLALETPSPTLVRGMHWLQSTLATRFNRFRRESGHLFQGRYKSILIENSAWGKQGQGEFCYILGRQKCYRCPPRTPPPPPNSFPRPIGNTITTTSGN